MTGPSRVRPDGRWKSHPGTSPGLLHLLARGEWGRIAGEGSAGTFRVDTPNGPFWVRRWGPGCGSGDLRCHRLARRIEAAGVATPESLGFYTRGVPWARETLWVVRWLDDLVPWWEHLATGSGRARGGRHADPAAHLGVVVGRLHGAGFGHPGLVGSLFFARYQEGVAPYLLAPGRVAPRSTRARRSRELVRLYERAVDLPSRTRTTFGLAYATAAAVPPADAHALWTRVRKGGIGHRAWGMGQVRGKVLVSGSSGLAGVDGRR